MLRIAATPSAHRARLRRVLAVAVVAATAFAALAVTSAPADAAARPHTRTTAEKKIMGDVLRQMNRERAAHHLPALRSNVRLENSARLHDYRMAIKQSLAHQLRGERSLGSRVTAAGYRWQTAGENIGWTSPRTIKRVLAMITMMYNERAPYDGHRQNILSRSYTDAGVDIYRDPAHGKIWLTVDFGRH